MHEKKKKVFQGLEPKCSGLQREKKKKRRRYSFKMITYTYFIDDGHDHLKLRYDSRDMIKKTAW